MKLDVYKFIDLCRPKGLVVISNSVFNNFSKKRLLIDSYLQHAAASLNLPSVVLWACNSPRVFGYKIHTNISAKLQPASLKNSMYEPFDILGDPLQLATHPGSLYNKVDVLKVLNFDTTLPRLDLIVPEINEKQFEQA